MYEFTLEKSLFAFLIIISAVYEVSATEWQQKKNHHVVRRSIDDDVRYWVGLSNEVLFNETLKPIAISRVPGTNGHDAVKEYILGELNSLQWNVDLDSFLAETPVGALRFTNIVATQDETLPRHLVLACHYDSKMDREKALVLATDSAVPCAMLLYMAKLLDSHLRLPRQNSNDVSLRFIFFDGEEAFVRWSEQDSLYGAKHLAQHLERKLYPVGATTNHLDRMDVMVLLDLLGSPNPMFYNYFTETKELFTNIVEIENTLHNMSLLVDHPKNYFINKRYYAGVEDDHIPFLQRGVRILHLIPQPFPDVWHQETDVVENLHFPTIENLNKILRVFVAQYLHLPVSDKTL